MLHQVVNIFPLLGVLVLQKSSKILFCTFTFLKKIYSFIYLWLCWVLFLCEGFLQLWQAGCHSSSQCADLSLSRPLLLRSTGSRHAGSVIVAHGPSRSAACGIFPDQGSNPCPLHWQADSQPLRHQGSPKILFCAPREGEPGSCPKPALLFLDCPSHSLHPLPSQLATV